MPRVSTVKPDGAAIRTRRELAGLTQAELAELLRRPGADLPANRRKTLSNLECGRQETASLRFIAQIAKVLEVEPEDLIKREVAA